MDVAGRAPGAPLLGSAAARKRAALMHGLGAGVVALLAVAAAAALVGRHGGPQRAALLRAPAGRRAPAYVSAQQARADLGSFFDTLHDRSKEWRKDDERTLTALAAPRTRPRADLGMTHRFHEVDRQLKEAKVKADGQAGSLAQALAALVATVLARKSTGPELKIAVRGHALSLTAEMGRGGKDGPHMPHALKGRRLRNVRSKLRMVGAGSPGAGGAGGAGDAPKPAKTDASKALTGNPAKDAELVKKSDRSEKPSDECIPPKAMVDDRCVNDPSTDAMPPAVAFACQKDPAGFACAGWHMQQKRRHEAYVRAISESGYNPYGAAGGRGGAHGAGHAGGKGGKAGREFGTNGPAGALGGHGPHEKGGKKFDHPASGKSFGDGIPGGLSHGSKQHDHHHGALGALGVGSGGHRGPGGGSNPNMIIPQRFPHPDGADLGDNYVSGISDHSNEERSFEDKFVKNDPLANKNHGPSVSPSGSSPSCALSFGFKI